MKQYILPRKDEEVGNKTLLALYLFYLMYTDFLAWRAKVCARIERLCRSSLS